MSPATGLQARDAEMHDALAEDGLDEKPRPPESAERAFWSWFGFCGQLLVLAVLAVIGAFAASRAERPGDYACGMILSLAAIALAFLRLKQQLDGGSPELVHLLLVDNMWNLAIIVPLFAIIGLAGLFIAHAWESGAMHAAGLALFIVSGVIIFLDLKHVFDRIEARGQC